MSPLLERTVSGIVNGCEVVVFLDSIVAGKGGRWYVVASTWHEMAWKVRNSCKARDRRKPSLVFKVEGADG